MLKRWLLVSCMLAAACGDDDKKEPNNEMDAGGDGDGDGDGDGPPEPPPVVQITNPGIACGGDEACMGPGAMCLTTITIPMIPLLNPTAMTIDFPEGYCSADCERAGECGEGSSCAVADLTDMLAGLGGGGGGGGGLGGILDSFLGSIPSPCLVTCDAAAPACRPGYSCLNLAEAFQIGGDLLAGLGGGVALPTYCVPTLSTGDGGVGDASVDDAGVPPSPTDSGTEDSGTPPVATDAGSDGG